MNIMSFPLMFIPQKAFLTFHTFISDGIRAQSNWQETPFREERGWWCLLI